MNVRVDGLRGISQEVELGDKTLITGPNGSGKSALAIGIDLAWLGYVPGQGPAEAVLNAANGHLLAEISLGDVMIAREWNRTAKGTSNDVYIQGERVSGGAKNKALIEEKLKNILPEQWLVFDVVAFWASSPNEKRRQIIALACDPSEYEKLIDDEAAARKELNALRANRQAAEKVVERLVTKLAETEKPTGNLRQLEQQHSQLVQFEKGLLDKIRTGEANDRAREGMDLHRKELQSLRERIEKGKVVLADAQAKLAKAIEADNALDTPPERQIMGYVDDYARNRIEIAVERLEAIDVASQADEMQKP
jgi:ABC-type Mn/Zn transport systems, ATPase component